MMLRRALLAWVGLWVAQCTAAPAAMLGGLEGGIEATDNVTRAVFEEDRESEQFVYLEPGGGWRLEAGTLHSFFLTGRLRVAAALQADGLTHYAPALGARWRGKTRVGSDAPRWLAELRAQWLGFDSEVRRGWLYDARAGYESPLGPRWRVRAEALASWREARSDAFSQDAIAAELGFERQLPGAWLLHGGYGYRDGEVTSTATPAAVDPRVVPILERSTARIDDDAFPGKIAYRLDAETHHLQIGASVALTRSGALDLRYRFESTDAGGGIDYGVSILRVTWLQSF
jgi:hypothetical protein